jgi:hypothetical protein
VTRQFDEQDLSRALADLRDAVHRRAGTPPAAARLRRLAERQRRARRAASVLAAAVAVTAVVAGGVTLVRGEALPPPQPGESSTPTPRRSPVPSPTPSSPPRTPATPVTADPITRVNWSKATIELAEHPGCPRGTVKLRPVPYFPEATGAAGGRQLMIGLDDVAYGDLTGDGRAEAVLKGTCRQDAEDSGDGQGQLLVVRRGDRDKLTGLGWAGPRGEAITGWWVAGGLLYADAKPHYKDWDYSLGAALAYRWTASGFTEVDVSEEFPGLVPVAGRAGVPADLTPVVDRLACRDGDVPDRSSVMLRLDAGGKGAAGGTTWDAGQPLTPDTLPHLVDLDGDGRRRLMVALYCGGADAETGPANLVVLERSADGYRAITVVIPEPGPRFHEWRWRLDQRVLSLFIGEGAAESRYRWNGRTFDPLDAEPTG